MINKRVLPILFLLLLAACQPAPIPRTSGGPSAPAVAPAAALAIQGEPGADTFHLVPLLAGTGQPVPGLVPLELGANIQTALSPEGDRLAVVSYGAANCPAICFHLFDLRAWKEVLPPVALGESDNYWTAEIAFDPASSRPSSRAAVAINDQAYQAGEVILIDLQSAKITARGGWDSAAGAAANAGADPAAGGAPGVPRQRYRGELLFRVRFTPDGYLALYGATGLGETTQHLRVALLETAGLEAAGKEAPADGGAPHLNLLWQQDLTAVQYGSIPHEDTGDPMLARTLDPGAVFSPDGAKLYIVAADEHQLVTVDFQRRAVTTATIQPRQSLLDRLMAAFAGVAQAKVLNGASKIATLSADGKRLFVTGQVYDTVKLDNGEYDTTVTPLGLQVIDPSSGVELARLDTDAANISIAPGGEILLTSWSSPLDRPATTIVDPGTLKVTATLPGEVRATRLLNGAPAYLAIEQQSETRARLSIYTPGAAHPISEWSVTSGYTDWLAIP